MTALRYQKGSLTADEIQAYIAEWLEPGGPGGDVIAKLDESQVSIPLSPGSSNDSLYSVRADGMGLDPGVVAIVVTFGPLVSTVLEDIWREQILPWIKRRRGNDAIGPEDPQGHA